MPQHCKMVYFADMDVTTRTIAGLQLTSWQPFWWTREKRFPPLGTELFYRANSAKKNFHCSVPQYGRLVTWFQSKNKGNNCKLNKGT